MDIKRVFADMKEMSVNVHLLIGKEAAAEAEVRALAWMPERHSDHSIGQAIQFTSTYSTPTN